MSRLFGIPAGEERRAARLCGLVFAISASFALLKSAQIGVFLDAYPASALPWAFALSALVLMIISSVSAALGGRLGPAPLLRFTLAGSGGVCLAVWGLLHTGVPGTAFAAYVVVEAVTGLLVIQTWSVVSEACNARSAKRLLPLAGVGASAAWIVGGAAVPLLVGLVGESGLIALAPALLSVGLLVLRRVVKQDLGRATRGHRRIDLLESWKRGLRFVVETPLMRIAAVLSVLLLVLEQLMDLGLMTAARAELGDGEAIAGFFGLYYALTSTLGLVLLLVVSGRLISKLGAPRTLLAAPGWACLVAGALLFFPGLVGAALLRGGYRVLKQALWSASLVQTQTPLPVVRRSQARALVRGVIGPGGYALSALALALIPADLDARLLVGGACAIGGAMVLVVALTVRRAYVAALRQSIDPSRLRLGEKGPLELGADVVQALERELRVGAAPGAEIAVELLGRDPGAFPTMLTALRHSAASVRAVSATQLARLGPQTAIGPLGQLLLTDPAVEVRRSCVRALRSVATARCREVFAQGLLDDDLEVRTWCRIGLSELDGDVDWAPQLSSPIATVREAALGDLARAGRLELLADVDGRAVRSLILSLGQTRGRQAQELLLELLGHHDPGVRTEATRAVTMLVRIRRLRLPSDRLAPLLEDETARAWNLVAIHGGLAHDDWSEDWSIDPPFDRLGRELELAIDASGRRLLCLLALSGERELVSALSLGLKPRRGWSVKVAELVDTAVDEDLRDELVPLFAPLSVRERFEAGRDAERIAAALLDPLRELRELNDRHLLRCAMVAYGPRFFERYPRDYEDAVIPLYQRLTFLRSVPLFARLGGEDLRAVAEVVSSRSYAADESVLCKGDPGDELFVIVQGAVAIRDKRVDLARLGPREVFGELAVLDEEPRSADCVAAEDTVVLVLNGADLAELMAHRPSIQEEILLVVVRRLREANAALSRRGRG